MAESIAMRDAAEVFACASAGLSPLGVVQKLTLETLSQNGYPTDTLHSKPIRSDEWAAADLVINMSGYLKERTFPRGEWHKVQDWDVDDPYGSAPKYYQEIFEDIRTRIKVLTARLRARG